MGERIGTQGPNWSGCSMRIEAGDLIGLSTYYVTTVYLNWKL